MENKLVAQTTHHAMGTIMTHKAFGPHAEDCLEAVCRKVTWIETLLSRFLPDSDISRLNRSAGIKSEKINPETYDVLSEAVEFSRCFPGCFDVTIAPLVALWHTGKESLTQPAASSIQQILPLVNYRNLILDPWEMTARLRSMGQSIDLGGIGKGFTGDRIREVFKQFGIASAYSNLGGNVVTVGTKPDGTPWHIGIQHPRREQRLLGAVSVVDQTVVTSGDYQRYYTDSQGKRYHHILNPRTGYPAESGLISVSIVSDGSLAADALSTIVFVAGIEKGVEFLKGFPQTDAILVNTDLQVYITPGLKGCFQAEQGIEVIILD
ncbi:MAG: FAD:protein FMN transferase [Anaerolineae bacterium]|nr:FAD:protein FMN transferase [Anaerolineae bacterium]